MQQHRSVIAERNHNVVKICPQECNVNWLTVKTGTKPTPDPITPTRQRSLSWMVISYLLILTLSDPQGKVLCHGWLLVTC